MHSFSCLTGGLVNFFPRLAWNGDHPDPCLLRSRTAGVSHLSWFPFQDLKEKEKDKVLDFQLDLLSLSSLPEEGAVLPMQNHSWRHSRSPGSTERQWKGKGPRLKGIWVLQEGPPN
jgi:hypothetical protein